MTPPRVHLGIFNGTDTACGIHCRTGPRQVVNELTITNVPDNVTCKVCISSRWFEREKRGINAN